MKIKYKHLETHDFPHALFMSVESGQGFANQLTAVVGQLTQTFGRGHPGVSVTERYFPDTRWCFWGTEFRFKTRDDAMLAKLTLSV